MSNRLFEQVRKDSANDHQVRTPQRADLSGLSLHIQLLYEELSAQHHVVAVVDHEQGTGWYVAACDVGNISVLLGSLFF